MSRARTAVVACVMVALGLAAGACSADAPGGAAAAVDADDVDLVSLSGASGTTDLSDNGRVRLELRGSDAFRTYGLTKVDARVAGDLPIDGFGEMWDRAELDTTPPGAVVELSDGTAVTLSDVRLDMHDGSDVTISGVPSLPVEPGTTAEWSMLVTPGTDATGPSDPPRQVADEVKVLTDEEVGAVLSAEPPLPSMTDVTLPGDAVVPSRFDARVEAILGDGEFELDVDTPGAARQRPWTATVSVVDGTATVTSSSEPSDTIVVENAEQRDAGVAVTLRVRGFDVGDVAVVVAAIRRLPSEGAPQPWRDVLGCADGVESFQWRNPDSDDVRVGRCPDPYRPVAASPRTPSLRPDPVVVATAANFDRAAELSTHLTDFVAAMVGPAPAAPRTVRIAVDASFASGARVPIIMFSVPVDDFDASAVAARIEQWALERDAEPTAFVLSATLSADVPSVTLSTVQDVLLPTR